MRLVADPSERRGRAHERAGKRSELETLRRAVKEHLQHSRAIYCSANPELQAKLAALASDLEGILMRLNLELAAPSRMPGRAEALRPAST